MKNDRTIHDLIIEQNNENKSFLVPSYQRGYRWQRVNVSDLLNDLNEFIHSDKETYSYNLLLYMLLKIIHIMLLMDNNVLRPYPYYWSI